MNLDDVEIHAWSRPRGAGGQHAGVESGAVLVIHTLTGIACRVSSERSQIGNKNLALARLEHLLGVCGGFADQPVKP